MSRTWWRRRPRGRFIHPCKGGCCGFLKTGDAHCYGCAGDLLSGLPAGSWREQDRDRPESPIPAYELKLIAMFT